MTGCGSSHTHVFLLNINVLCVGRSGPLPTPLLLQAHPQLQLFQPASMEPSATGRLHDIVHRSFCLSVLSFNFQRLLSLIWATRHGNIWILMVACTHYVHACLNCTLSCRKNPQHFLEYSHPDKDADGSQGDSGTASGSAQGSLQECPYGQLCYRYSCIVKVVTGTLCLL